MSEEAKCDCQHCGEHIAFPGEAAGQNVTCPHCGYETALFLPQVRKVNPVSNALVPRNESISVTQSATKILFVIIGIAVTTLSLFFFIHHQNEVTQSARNFKELTNPYREPTRINSVYSITRSTPRSWDVSGVNTPRLALINPYSESRWVPITRGIVLGPTKVAQSYS